MTGNRDDYPAPRQKPKVVVSNATPEFGNNRQEWEERLFRRATMFNVVRPKSHNGSMIATVKTFGEALYLAHDATQQDGKNRVLIYAATDEGDAFCIPQSMWGRYAVLTLQLREVKKS